MKIMLEADMLAGAAIEFFNKVAELAEAEGHHPDLHLESYREVKVGCAPTMEWSSLYQHTAHSSVGVLASCRCETGLAMHAKSLSNRYKHTWCISSGI